MPLAAQRRDEVAPEGPTLAEILARGGTLAEAQGITREMGDVIARLAEGEVEAGRAESARVLLEGLVATNHLDPEAWALLSRAHRRLGHPLVARLCAEVGVRLAPEDPGARLARAEALLACGEREEGRAEVARLVADGQVGARATSLLAALGP